MTFDPNISVGNVITIGITLVGGIGAFYAIISKLTIAQHQHETMILGISAQQEKSTALLEQSVTALKDTAQAMQSILGEQQKQLSKMTTEVEIERRLREAQAKS